MEGSSRVAPILRLQALRSDDRIHWRDGVHGQPLRSGHLSIAKGVYWVGDIPWVFAKDMKSDVLLDASTHVSEAAVTETATQIAPIGSLLVLVRGIGLANGVPICELARPCAFNQDVKALLPQ